MESKVYHLLALIIVSRYMPGKSVFFTHAVTSFKNHYGIDLQERAEMEQCLGYNHQAAGDNFSIMHFECEEEEAEREISHLIEDTYGEDADRSIKIHESEAIKGN